MSHFSVAVFTDEYTDVDDLLEPFGENFEVEEYVYLTKNEVIEEGLRIMGYYIRNHKKETKKRKYIKTKNNTNCKKLKELPEMEKWKRERIYKIAASNYRENTIGENGDIYTTSNPNSKWDWYVEGGRWKNMLVTKDGEKTNYALVEDIDWDKMEDFNTYAVLRPDGEWIEPGEMGWWGVSYATPEEEERFMENYKKDIIDTANKDWTLTIVDCHI